MTSEEVEMAKGDGTLRGLLADLNRVAVAAALVDARDAAIDAAEAAGDITADQAELLRETGQSFGGKARGHGHHGRVGKDCGTKSADGAGHKRDGKDIWDAGDSP